MKNIQQYILKEKEIFVGLEDSKRSWKICVRSAGIVVNETSMPAKYQNLLNYFHHKFPDCKITVMYEAGFRGFELYDSLKDDGYNCIVTPPHTVVQEKCSRLKNDRIDCRRLAKNLENNDFRQCHVFDKEHRHARQVSRTYEQIKKDIIRTRNRIRREVDLHGIDDQFSPGKWNEGHYKFLAFLVEKKEFSPALCLSLGIKLSELTMLKEYRKKVKTSLFDLAKSDRYLKSVTLLKSAPGIGKLTAIRLALEWGDVGRFKRNEEFSKFLGLIPSEFSTGDHEWKGHITKQGNRQVRSWLIESSWVAIRYDPVLLEKYQAVYSNSGSKKKAIVAVARKFAIRLRAILMSGQCYEIGLVK